MIIHRINEDEDEYEEVAHVFADGSVDGNTPLADQLREDLDDEGMMHPDGTQVKDGLKLMMLLEHRYNNGYFITEWETEDADMLKERLEDDEE